MNGRTRTSSDVSPRRNENVTSQLRHHQLDRGWSWVVMIGHFIVNLIVVGHQKCNGIFFVEIQEKFHVTASMTSLVAGVSAACYSVGAVFVMTCIINVISERQCVMIGAFLMTLAQVLCSFSTSFPLFIVTLGTIQGVGASFIYGPSFVILGKYFSRRLTLAQAFVTSGVSVGGVVGPLLVRAALDEYSFPSGMLIIGGIIAHIFVCAVLFRPVGVAKPKLGLLAAEQGEKTEKIDVDRVTSSSERGEKEKSFLGDTGRIAESHNNKNNGNGTACSCYAESRNRDDDERNREGKDFRRNGAEDIPPSSEAAKEFCVDIHQTDDKVLEEAQLYNLSDIESALLEETEQRVGEDVRQGTKRTRTVSEGATNRTRARHSTELLASSLQNMTTPRTVIGSSSGALGEAGSYWDRLSSANSVLAFSGTPESMCVSLTVLDTSHCNLYSSNDSSFAASPREVRYSPALRNNARNNRVKGSMDSSFAGSEKDVCAASPVSRDKERSACFRCSRVFDLSICKSALFWGLLCTQATGFLTGALAPAFLPPLAKEKGLTDREATHLLTVMGGLDVISRVLPGVIAHYKLLKPSLMVMITLFVLGVSCQFVRFLDTFAAMMVFCALFGSLAGVFFSMTPAVVIHFMGLERFATAFGFIQLFNGVASAVTYPLLGLLKDKTGSYAASYHYLGATALFSAVLLASLPLWGRVQKSSGSTREIHTNKN